MAVIVALASTLVLRVVLAPLLRPAGWGAYYYLQLLLPLALFVAWCVALLPRETRALVRRARADGTLAPVAALVVLLVASLSLVSASDLAFQLVGKGSAMQNRLAIDVIQWRAWVTTSLLLFAALTFMFAATSSAATAMLFVAPLFATMSFATLAKITYMHSAVQPLDLLSLPEFMPLFASFFGMFALVTGGVALVLWIAALVVAARRWRTEMSTHRRLAIGVAALAPLCFVAVAALPASRLPRPFRDHSGWMWPTMVALGMPSGEHREMARNGGIVLNFLAEVPAAFVETPPDYSAQRAAATLHRYRADESESPAKVGGVNLVVYLVESLMDPADLGLRFTEDPMPNIHALQREQVGGTAIVARSFGGSANGEFEVLTGMTTSFLPAGALAYRQFVRRPLETLPRVLHELGYASVAVQAGPRHYYDRERVYPLLGFDRTAWLFGAPGIPRADRGNWPTDDAIVDTVIQVSQEKRPFFVFAFPASSHSPYTFGAYRASALDVAGAPTTAAAAEVKEYVNAVRIADRAVGRLIEHFRGRSDSTVIAIMGDHLPPLSSDAVRRLTEGSATQPAAVQTRALLRVPLVIWANFRLPHEQATLSLNMLAPYLLERVGAPRRGLFAVTDSLRHLMPVAGTVVQDTNGQLWLPGAVPAPLRSLLDDYRVVQYDQLFGRRQRQRH